MKLNLMIWGLLSLSVFSGVFSQQLLQESSAELPFSSEEMMILKSLEESNQLPPGISLESTNKRPNSLFRTKYYLYQEWEFTAWKDVDSVSNTFLQKDIIDNALEFGFDGMNWSQKLRNQYTYDADFQITEILTDTLDNQNWRPHSQSLKAYNSDGDYTLNAKNTWNGSGWDEVWRWDYIYDSNNNLTQRSYSNNPNMAGLEPVLRYDQTYDFLNRISTLIYLKNSGTGLENSSKTTYAYPPSSDDYPLGELHQLWDGQEWENNNKFIYSYSGGLKTERLKSSWNGSAWEDITRSLYVYDSDSLLISDTHQSWNGTSWENKFLISYNYTNGLISIYLIQNYDGATLINNERYLYTHSATGLLEELISQSWNVSQWKNNYRYVYEYDGDGNLTKHLHQNGPVNDYQYLYFYESYDSTSTSIDGLLTPVDHKVYPNPFNDQLTVEYNNDSHETANLVIYSIDGKMIMGIQASGSTNEITWKGTDAYGKALPNGMYTYKLVLGDKASTGKVVLSR